MTNRVFRYRLTVTDEQRIEIPFSYQVLSVAPGRDGYHIDLWALVNPEDVTIYPKFCVVGTGHPMPEDALLFVGTAVMSDGLVWHVFTESVEV